MNRDPELERIVAGHEARRLRLASLPFPEKVKLLVRLQRLAAPIQRARGVNVRAWHLDESPEP